MHLRWLSRMWLVGFLSVAAYPGTAQQTPVAKAAAPDGNRTAISFPIVVRDHKGAVVSGISKDDLSLQVDGHAQAISTFAPAGGLPVTLGLLVDTSASQRSELDEERASAQDFLSKLVEPAHAETGAGTASGTQAFVLQFSRQAELLEDPTNSEAKLKSALGDLGTGPGGRSSGAADDSDSDSEGRRKTAGAVLNDALFLASDEVLAKHPGRKVLVILSDGVDADSKESQDRAIEAAQRSGTVVYAIYIKDQEAIRQQRQQSGYPGRGGYPGGGYPGGGYPGGGYPGGGYPGGGYPGGGYPGGGGQQPGQNNPQRTPVSHVDGKRNLDRIAQQTGGRVFELSRRQTFAECFDQIGEDLRGQMIVEFTPDAKLGGGYHQIDLAPVEAQQKKLTVQAPDGFFGGS